MSNIKVAVRIRPISEREITITGAEIVVHTDGNEVSLTNLKVSSSKAGDSRKRTRRYGFDYCFNSSSLDSEVHATQEKVYEMLGKSALDALFNGFNACLVAYGQSASGKTYTMMGPKNDPGLTPRLCEGLFFRIFEEQKNGGYYDTAVSYLEIYNERVRDLLKPSTNSSGLRVREHPRLGPYVQGLTRHTVSTLGSLMSYVEEGTRARKTASTSQNPTSSRSHALLTVSLTSKSENSSNTTTTTNGLENKQHVARGAKLHLVDLAGSERAGNSNYGLHRLKEGANINKSLVALGNVISALAERGATGSGPGRRFIPYRDSALTWLLKDALGGNAATIMLATISPASGSYNETAHTLRFAQRAQSVVNRPVVNEDPVARIIRELRAEISRLTSLLSEKGSGGEPGGSSCCCKRPTEAVGELLEDAEETVVSINDDKSGSTELPDVDKRESSIRGSPSLLALHRRCSSVESLSSSRHPEDNETRSPRRFGSLRSLDSSSEKTLDFQEQYDGARISSVSYDRVNGLALVDIPTLVAVLIKPDDSETHRSSTAQIEEISSENILDNSVELESFENGETSITCQSNEASLTEVIKPIDGQTNKTESRETVASVIPGENNTVTKNYQQRDKRVKHDGIATNNDNKKSSSLNSSKKFGSSESFDSVKTREGNGLVQRSYTNLQLERSRQSNVVNPSTVKTKPTWSPRGSIFNASRKVETGEKDLPKKSAPDVDKSQQKPRNPLRKQDSESPKRKISKDVSESALTPTPKLVRKGSVTGEITSRTHTPIQRTNRRAEIVAAVTERLYSTKKAAEESTGNCPAGENFRSPESTEVKLANSTRMKLQEISRKMLAKRRRTCADTQTDIESTVRVKDTASITDSTEIETKDAAVITDVHENCGDVFPENSKQFSVTRVKEIATLTEKFARTVCCKDVAILTEDYDDEDDELPGTVGADSSQDRKEVIFVENSTNTTQMRQNRNSGSQTFAEDVLTDSKKIQRGCSGCHNVRECHYQVPVSGLAERNVICITLPDMLSITIESSNTLESKIAVTEGIGTVATDENVTSKVKDGETQTESCDKSDLSSKFNHIVPNDLSSVVTTRSAACQSDGKTFRIENIFKDPKNCEKTMERETLCDLIPDFTEHIVPKTSLKLTNSVGTSFTPETTERSTEIERINFTDQNNAAGHSKDFTWRQLPSLKLSKPTLTRQAPVWCERPPSPSPVSSPIRQEKSFGKDESLVEINSKSIPRRTVTRIDAEELKSPLLVARLISNSSVEIESNFSDDSLDPDEINAQCDGKNILSRLDESLCPPDVVAHTKKEVYESRVDEDFADEVVEFPRSSVTLESNTSRVHDYESLVLGRNCFVPICQDSGESSRIETPESEEGRNQSKKKVSFSNSKQPNRPQLNDARKPKPIIKNKSSTFAPIPPPRSVFFENDGIEESKSNQSTKSVKLNSSTPLDYSTSENSFRDDISSISGSSETVRSGTLYNSDEDSDPQLERSKRDESEMKRVRFTSLLFAGERGESLTSDSDGCENAVSDEESFCCDAKSEIPQSLFASYLDEATAFVHNMNTTNEYVNANHRLFLQDEKNPEDDYIEYNGCRISLRDDTDDYLKPENFTVPVDSYKNCLRGIAKLENCIEKAVRHDKFLLDKYEIRLESAATNFGLVDPGKDSSRLISGVGLTEPLSKLSSFQNPGAFTTSVEDLAVITDEETCKEDNQDLENDIFEHLMESASPRRRNASSAKPYFRRSTRMTDLSGNGPASYSRLRKKYHDPGSYGKHSSPVDSTWYTAALDSGSAQSSVERDLKIPQCFLVVPETTQLNSVEDYRNDDGRSSSEAVGTSSESIDTVASVRNKFRYPGSPRAKLLQLVSERRQIVHRSRNESPR